MVIYKITNKINGKSYIGQTIGSIESRWKAHNWTKNGCRVLKNAIDKYGKDNFKIEVIEVCNSLEQLDKQEMFWIKELNTLVPHGYNLKTGGNRSAYSDETRKRMSDAKKTDFIPWNKGLTKTDDPRIGNQGSRGTENPRLGKPGYWLGKKMPPSTGEKLSRAKKGKPLILSPEGCVARLEGIKKLRIQVFCHQNKKTYISISEAEKDLGLQPGNISRIINGKQRKTKGYTFAKVLK